jgi:phage host-nuclease inhibitor protein Gam
MSFAFPVRLGVLRPARHPQHRAIDEVERQKALRTGADLLIKTLYVQLDDLEQEHAETIARIDERHAETVAELRREIADLRRRLAIACQATAAADQTQEIPAEVVRRITAAPVPLHQAPFATTDPGRLH